jgi:hypothetical protein
MKDGRSNEYNNQTIQNEKNIICINDETKVHQVLEEKENPSLQTKVKKRLNTFCNSFKIKEKTMSS